MKEYVGIWRNMWISNRKDNLLCDAVLLTTMPLCSPPATCTLFFPFGSSFCTHLSITRMVELAVLHFGVRTTFSAKPNARIGEQVQFAEYLMLHWRKSSILPFSVSSIIAGSITNTESICNVQSPVKNTDQLDSFTCTLYTKNHDKYKVHEIERV